jgi:hypothetical protein
MLDKAIEIGSDSADLGLLEHDSGNPNLVRVATMPPREIGTVLVEPVFNCMRNLNIVFRFDQLISQVLGL